MTKDELDQAVAAYEGSPRVDGDSGTRFEAHRERVRKETMAEIPSWYSPWGHLAATTGLGATLLVLGAWKVHAPTLLEWLVVPVVLVFGNAFEWRAHKHVLHRRTWPVEIIYDRHTPIHHMVFTTEDMALRSTREFRLVLIPAAGVLSIVLSVGPLAALLGYASTPNAGWLLLVTAGLYMVLYELTHLAYHMPDGSFVGGLRVVQRLRQHHAKHHDPRLMQAWNFNVTVPLFDWIMGTLAPKDAPRRPTPIAKPRANEGTSRAVDVEATIR